MRQGRAHTRDLIGSDAHAHSGRADQHAEFGSALRHTPRHRLRKIRIIGGFFGTGAKICHAHASLLEMLLDGFLELEAAVIGAESNGRGFPGHRDLRLVQETQQRSDALLDLVAAIEIHLVRAADGIADVLIEKIECFVEFAQQKGPLGCLRKEQTNGVYMAVGHAEDIVGLLHQLSRQWAAALARDVDP